MLIVLIAFYFRRKKIGIKIGDTIIMSTERFIHARFKSIDLAEIEIAKLKHGTQNCEPRTPEIAVLSSKYIEQAFYEK